MSCILVADDDGHIREVIRFTCSRPGTRSSRRAMAKKPIAGSSRADRSLHPRYPHARADGLDTCRRIRAHSRIPIIFVSSRDEELDRVLGLELGADDYLVKPFRRAS